MNTLQYKGSRMNTGYTIYYEHSGDGFFTSINHVQGFVTKIEWQSPRSGNDMIWFYHNDRILWYIALNENTVWLNTEQNPTLSYTNYTKRLRVNNFYDEFNNYLVEFELSQI